MCLLIITCLHNKATVVTKHLLNLFAEAYNLNSLTTNQLETTSSLTIMLIMQAALYDQFINTYILQAYQHQFKSFSPFCK